ncbi:MAG: exo-alpha-sialidase, partial [Oscillospiraceae bacterium]|nr:exo-alpha-sialidase [Oscillospiraceae bacterium]
MKLLSKTLLPVPTRSCHASTLCAVPGGEGGTFSLLAAWFGGQRESADDVEIWLSRGEPDGDGHYTRWSDAVQMSETSDRACWNP